MPIKRPQKLPAGWQGSGRSGGIVRGLLGSALTDGGSEVSPIAPGDVPYNDPTFDANTQLRFKAANPVRNFLSGNQGGNTANQLNTEQAVNDQSRINQKSDTIEIANLEAQLNKDAQEFIHSLKLGDQVREDTSAGQAFRGLNITNPDIAPNINIPAGLSDQYVGNLLRHALGGNLGQQGLIAGIPTSRATAATQKNTEAQANAQQPYIPDITKAIELFKLNEANSKLKASQGKEFGPAVSSNLIHSLRTPEVNNRANNRFNVGPMQTVVEPDINNPTNQPTLYKGPQVLTKMVESPPQQIGDVTIPGKPIREQEVVEPFQIQRPIKISNPNPNPSSGFNTNGVAPVVPSPSPVPQPQQPTNNINQLPVPDEEIIRRLRQKYGRF